MFAAGRSAGDVRRHNRAVVLELVRTRSPVSRAELARAVNLSVATVIEIVGELVELGLVREVGVGPSTGGRRPILLEMVPQARYAVGIEVGTRVLTAIVVDLEATPRLKIRVPSKMAGGPEAVAGQVRAALRRLLRQVPGELGAGLGIGVAFPAPIIASASMDFSPPSFPGWGRLDLGALISDEHDLPVIVDNDANAAALGEHLFGAGRGVRNMFYVVAHRGVGGAAIVDGDLRRGANGGAGEIGHTLIDLDGPLCGCGRYGCLEAFVGKAAIARRARRALKRAGAATFGGKDADSLEAEDVISAALQGDELARKLLEETGEYLGIGISNAVNLLDPELVVVGGATMRAGEIVLGPAAEVARRRDLCDPARRIVAGELGEDAGSVGAAALVLRELFAVSVYHEKREAPEDDLEMIGSG